MATGMLFGCAVVLMHLAYIGRRHAESADALAIAQMACYSKMNALLCGAETIETINREPMSDLPGWVLSVETEDAEQEGIRVLRVSVAEDVESELGMSTVEGMESPDETFGDKEKKGRSFTLVRWIFDAKASGSESDLPDEPGEDNLGEPPPPGPEMGGPDGAP